MALFLAANAAAAAAAADAREIDAELKALGARRRRSLVY